MIYKEITDHMTSGCPELEKSEYIFWHKTASYILWNICKEYSMKMKVKQVLSPGTCRLIPKKKSIQSTGLTSL